MKRKLHFLLEKAIKNESIVEDSWKGFIYKVFPEIEVLSKTQYEEMRKAYYCGCFAMFTLMFEISNTIGEADEEGAAKILENINNKCQEEIKKFASFDSLK